VHDFCNPLDAVIVVNQILSNLDSDMRQPRFFRVLIDRVILQRLARIRFVVANEVARLAQIIYEYFRGDTISVPQNTHLPGSGVAIHYRRKTVNRDEYRLNPVALQATNLSLDGPVIWPVNLVRASNFVLWMQVSIAGNDDAITEFEERTRIHQLPVAVDDKARILAKNSGDTQANGQFFCQRSGANIEGKMAAARKGIEPHGPEGFRKTPAGMITNQQNG